VAELNKVFEFKECVNILKATGKKASTLRELRDLIGTVSDDSIFHHTYQYFLKEHVQEYTNDFAHWAGESLEERFLAEHLSNIDPYDFRDIEDLRNEILRVIDDYLEKFPEPREVIPGYDFFFNQTITLTFPTGVKARNLAEFLIGVKYVDTASIYYHFYEARTRLRGGVDDFSLWVEQAVGKKDLAEKIRATDPFMHSVEEIKEHIVEAVEDEVKKDMEIIAK
jgi:hypothetical protein